MRGPDADAPDSHPAVPPPVAEPIVIELALAPVSAGRLMRSPALAGLRTGPARGAGFRLTWFDTADGALAARGQAFELEPLRRGTRQLLRQVLPDESTAWIPGSPGAVLTEARSAGTAPDPAVADLPPHTPLVAIAAAEGHRRTLPIAWQGTAATLTLLHAKLRTVAAESEVARLLITAPAAAAFAIAAHLAEDHALLPAVPLAEAARSLALGQPPRPARRGAPGLDAAMRVEDGLVHAGLHLIAVLLSIVPAVTTANSVEAVHQTRVTLRRLRSALAVWREAIAGDGMRALDRALRDMAQRLGPVRDLDVLLGGLLAELESALAAEGAAPDDGLAGLRAALAARREAAHRDLAAWLESAAFRQLAFAALAQFSGRGWRAEGGQQEKPQEGAAWLALLDSPLGGFAARVLQRRSRKLLRQADDLAGVPIAVLHAIRLSAKRLRYAAEFFAPLYPARRAKRYLRRLAALQEALGTVNDGAVVGSLVRTLPAARGQAALGRAWAAGALEGFAAARAATARDEAARAWRKVWSARPFWTD